MEEEEGGTEGEEGEEEEIEGTNGKEKKGRGNFAKNNVDFFIFRCMARCVCMPVHLILQ